MEVIRSVEKLITRKIDRMKGSWECRKTIKG